MVVLVANKQRDGFGMVKRLNPIKESFMNESRNELGAFSSQANKIQEHMDFFQSIKADMNFEANKEAEITLDGVKEEPLIAVMVHFRNFYMKTSNLYFPNVVQMILNTKEYMESHELAQNFLDVWNQLLSPQNYTIGGMQIKLGENNPLSGKKNLDVWMNEGYLHVDQYKHGSRKGLDAIKSQPIFEGLSKISMVDLLQRLSGLVVAFDAQVVDKILSKN